MYKRIKRHKLGRKKSHRESLVRNLLRSLFDNTYVVTTTSKAKVLKQEASSLISKGADKKDDLSFRRELRNVLGNEDIVKKFKEYVKKDDIGVGFVRVGYRAGDNAEVARVYLLGLDKKKPTVKKEEKKEDEKKVEKTVEKENVRIDIDKKVDKTAVIKKSGRARSRSGI